MDIEATHTETQKTDKARPEKGELAAVKKMISVFTATFKNYTLYSEDHNICKNNITTIFTQLEFFFRQYGSLKLHVEKNGFRYKNESILLDPRKEGELNSLLYRDGVIWVELKEELTIRELEGLFRILRDNRFLGEEAPGDVVTALWEENYSGIRYEARDLYWETEAIINLSGLNKGMPTYPTAQLPGEDSTEDLTKEEDSKNPDAKPLFRLDPSLWELSSQEKKKLRQMVLMEENRDCTGDVLEVLTLILEEQTTPQELMEIVEFMKEECRLALSKGELSLMLDLLKGLKDSMKQFEKHKPWAVPLVEELFSTVSEKDFLSGIMNISPGPDHWEKENNQEKLKEFWQFLQLLQPRAMPTLLVMMPNIRSKAIRTRLTEIVIGFANRDISPLEPLLNTSDEPVALALVHVLSHTRKHNASAYLQQMLHHPSVRVREKTFQMLFKQGQDVARKLFRMVDSRDPETRKMVLHFMGKRKNDTAEDMLLHYLENNPDFHDDDHIVNCYQTLGRCGSQRSVPFLEAVLFDKGWAGLFGAGNPVRRKAAALALFELNDDDAREVISRASKSLIPGVRTAYRAALALKRNQ